MDAPQNGVWGPALWTILHSCCERIGFVQPKKLPLEESRIWFGLLQSLRYSLPCPQCKKHYTTYANMTPIMKITRENLRRWLYNLHNEVNQRLQKVSPTMEETVAMYERPFYFTEFYTIVHDHMIASVRRGWSIRNDVEKTLRFLKEMQCFYDLD